MSVTLNITCDSAAELVDEFRKINTLTTEGNGGDPITTLANIPLDTLVDMARERLRDAGFKLDIIDQRDPNPAVNPPVMEPALEPEPKAKKARAKAEPDAPSNVPSNVEEFPAPRRSKNPNGVDPMDTLKDLASDPEGDPEGDRQFVLDTLAGMLKGKQKDKVLEFTGAQAKLHGAEKISALPAEPFPSIRREMEKVFPNARSA